MTGLVGTTPGTRGTLTVFRVETAVLSEIPRDSRTLTKKHCTYSQASLIGQPSTLSGRPHIPGQVEGMTELVLWEPWFAVNPTIFCVFNSQQALTFLRAVSRFRDRVWESPL